MIFFSFFSSLSSLDFDFVFGSVSLVRGGGRRKSRKKRRMERRKKVISEGFFEGDELDTLAYLSCGLGMRSQENLCREWRQDGLVCLASKYKSVDKKVRPVNEAMPQHLNPPLKRPDLSRDPYDCPLSKNPPEFQGTAKVTEERLKMVNFGPDGWLSDEEMKLILQVIVLREGAVAFDEYERGCLKHEWGMPYVIPVVDHKPWQKRAIPIPKAIKEDYVELVRERLRTGLYEQSTSSYSSPVFCVLKQDGKKLRVVHDLQELNKVTIKDAGLPPAPEDFVEAFAGRACYGLGDIMGGYDERELAHE